MKTHNRSVETCKPEKREADEDKTVKKGRRWYRSGARHINTSACRRGRGKIKQGDGPRGEDGGISKNGRNGSERLCNPNPRWQGRKINAGGLETGGIKMWRGVTWDLQVSQGNELK